jgi:predicted HAD superfamily Cof-like phosphohydrolase
MGRSGHQLRIEDFMKKAGQVVPERPLAPTPDVALLRARLILEEAFETIEALGVHVFKMCPVNKVSYRATFGELELVVKREPNLPEIVDGCADLSVVTIGTLSALGVQDAPVLELVDYNNLAKFGPGGKRDPGGKWIKPPNHKPPDIAGELERQRTEEYHGN